MQNHDLVLSISTLLKTNNGFFKSEKQAKFILSNVSDNEIVNHFTTYGNVARDHYHLDEKGVYKIERYTTKKGYVTTWQRGQVHSLAAAKKRDDAIKQGIEQQQLSALGYIVESKTFYTFIDLFDSLNNNKTKFSVISEMKNDCVAIESYLQQVSEFEKAVNDFKQVYFSCMS